MRLYIQELDANGNHLSWNIFYFGETKAGQQTFEYTIGKGSKAVFYIDKPNPSDPLNFHLDNVNVTP